MKSTQHLACLVSNVKVKGENTWTIIHKPEWCNGCIKVASRVGLELATLNTQLELPTPNNNAQYLVTLTRE